MKRIKLFLVFSSFCTLLSSCIYSQNNDFITFLKEMNASFAKHQSIQANYKITITDDKNKTAFNYTQKTIRFKNLLWADALNTTLIQNKQFFIKADHTNKLLVVEKKNNTRSEYQTSFDSQIEQMFQSGLHNVQMKKIDAGRVQFTAFTIDNQQKFVVVLNAHTYALERVTAIYYSGTSIITKIDIIVEEIVFDKKFDIDIFSEKSYIKIKNGKITPTDKYRNYNLIVINNEK